MTQPPTSTRAGRRSRSGFTLVELMTSIGIIIFILSVTVVAFGPLMKTSGTKSASRNVRTVLEGARIRAIQQHRPVRFEAQLVKGTEATTKQWCVTPNAGDPLHEWSKLPEFVAITLDCAAMSLTFTAALARVAVTFGPDGSVVRIGASKVDDKGAVSPLTPKDNPTDLFTLYIGNMRETATADFKRYVDVIPLTGGTVSRDDTGEVY